jgi:hypothetical protein
VAEARNAALASLLLVAIAAKVPLPIPKYICAAGGDGGSRGA